LQFTIRKSYPFFFVSYLLNDLKVILLVTKLISAIIILAFLNGFFLETYDSRVVMLGFLGGLVSHSVMVNEFRNYEERFLGFYRNLPHSMLRRWLNLVVVYALVLLPEWIIFGSAIPLKLLPLDAMMVAVLWHWFFAFTAHGIIPYEH
jgi:hypothetical protein